MFKYFKYELFNNLRTNIYIFLGILLCNIIISSKISLEIFYFQLNSLVVLTCISLHGLLLHVNYKSIIDDLYTSKGYFTFSLPVSGYTIFFTKIAIEVVYIIAFTILDMIFLVDFKYFIKFYIHNLYILRILPSIIIIILFLFLLIIVPFISTILTHKISKSKKLISVSILPTLFIIYMAVIVISVVSNNLQSTLAHNITTITTLLIFNILLLLFGGYELDKNLEI